MSHVWLPTDSPRSHHVCHQWLLLSLLISGWQLNHSHHCINKQTVRFYVENKATKEFACCFSPWCKTLRYTLAALWIVTWDCGTSFNPCWLHPKTVNQNKSFNFQSILSVTAPWEPNCPFPTHGLAIPMHCWSQPLTKSMWQK